MTEQTRIEKTLALFEDDWMEKYQYIIQLGRVLQLDII